MSKIAISPGATGNAIFTIQAPSTETSRTLTLPDESGTVLTSASPVIAQAGVPAFSAYATSATSVVNGAAGTQIALQTKVFDTASCFDTSTGKFTPTVAGYYQITGSVSFGDAPITGSAIYAGISKNGTDVNTIVNRSMIGGVTSGYVQCVASALVYLNGATDYVCLVAYQNQGSARNIQYGFSAWTSLSGCLVRAA